mmetsp:Transcript_98174/g.260828  ORF Transcript_98174/g.260828 Transcript_98174/m.260828 type:complete len:208 (+) Transcript_98174:655-1278(+)
MVRVKLLQRLLVLLADLLVHPGHFVSPSVGRQGQLARPLGKRAARHELPNRVQYLRIHGLHPPQSVGHVPHGALLLGYLLDESAALLCRDPDAFVVQAVQAVGEAAAEAPYLLLEPFDALVRLVRGPPHLHGHRGLQRFAVVSQELAQAPAAPRRGCFFARGDGPNGLAQMWVRLERHARRTTSGRLRRCTTRPRGPAVRHSGARRP